MDESASRERKGAPATRGASEAEDKEELLLHSRDEQDDDEGRRQPYKCTFCRRGFPTAQALGGHMNIHRKHRGTTMTTGSSSSSAPASAAGRSSGNYNDYEQQHSSLATTTSPWSSMATGHGESFSSHHAAEREPQELPLFLVGPAGRRGHRGPEDDVQEDRYRYSKDDDGDGDQGGGEEELDLELRLGGGAGSS